MSVAEKLEAEHSSQEPWKPEEPDISHLITEDDTPVDNQGSEMNQRLLAGTLRASWKPPFDLPFVVCANVGIYETTSVTAIVPDVLVSLDVSRGANIWEKRNGCYFVWIFGKPPDLVVEIVSERNGLELSGKIRRYARIGISYYAVFDPNHHLSDTTLQCFELRGGKYEELEKNFFPRLQLGPT